MRTERAWRLGANTYLPPDVSLVWVREVPEQFHARFSATARSYRYVILNRDSRPGLATGRATWERRPLDAERMHAAAQGLVGEHDFSAFRAIECQSRSPVRLLERIDVTRNAEWVTIGVTANAFLHHMVRNLVGVLIEIGRAEQPVEWARRVLESRDRTQGGITAPAEGLYLWSVEYPSAFGLPAGGASVMISPPFGARV
jgi:tRNA pseudouridine38-40 synthase